MARGRMLNKTIALSDKFASLKSHTAIMVATWVIPHLDRRGVYYADPRFIKSQVMPLIDIETDTIAACVEAMVRSGLIRLFEANGKRWMVWPGFADNQTGCKLESERTTFPEPPPRGEFDLRQMATDIPPPTCGPPTLVGPLPAIAASFPQSVQQGNGNEEKRIEKNLREDAPAGAPAPSPDVSVESMSQPSEPPATPPRDLLFDAIAAVTASDVKLLGPRIGKVAAEFRKIDATPEQVHQVAAWFKANDWRGRKGDQLTFALLKEVWQAGLTGAPVRHPGKRLAQVADISEAQRLAAAQKARASRIARQAGSPNRVQEQLAAARAGLENATKRNDRNAMGYFQKQIEWYEKKVM